MFSEFSMRQFVSAFVVLFAVIDVLGSVPIILKLKSCLLYTSDAADEL